ncbi:hypothetical protein, partial [Bradyrhizobium sp. AUGA SZCCT0283]|uniref:hypothetical protein n=1 Tax=Bradyrhizobium sp. AUGA SZCCT0283 TaxID=2807671 RepID=UPI001BA55688
MIEEACLLQRMSLFLCTFETCRPALKLSAYRGDRKSATQGQNDEIDPHVWSGRALQEDFAELAVSGLASM